MHDVQPATLLIERQGARIVAARPDIILMRQRTLRRYGKVPDAVMQTVSDIQLFPVGA